MTSFIDPPYRKLGYPGIQSSPNAIKLAPLSAASAIVSRVFCKAADLSNQQGSSWGTASAQESLQTRGTCAMTSISISISFSPSISTWTQVHRGLWFGMYLAKFSTTLVETTQMQREVSGTYTDQLSPLAPDSVSIEFNLPAERIRGERFVVRNDLEDVLKLRSSFLESFFDVAERPVDLFALVFGPNVRVVSTPASCIPEPRCQQEVSVGTPGSLCTLVVLCIPLTLATNVNRIFDLDRLSISELSRLVGSSLFVSVINEMRHDRGNK